MKKHPGLGLDYCGITIIPPRSLKEFKKIIARANKQFKSSELENLINKINIAIRDNKHLIHYGIQILKYMFSNKINFEYDIIFKVVLK